MNRRTYLQALTALFATTALGSCSQGSVDRKEEKLSDKADKAATLLPGNASFDVPNIPEDNLNFYLVSDLGRNGYYEQKPIAELMGNLAEKIDLEFVVAAGDTHHFNGVASTQDPLWMTNYELIYSHPELMLDWFAINGNHEYRRYYSKVFEAGENESLEIFFLDTPPLIEKYRKNSEKYADAGKQSIDDQLKWLEKSLAASKAKWKLAVGHHPIFADTSKSDTERKDMQERVKPLLEKYGVDMYLCGHICTFVGTSTISSISSGQTVKWNISSTVPARWHAR